MHSLRSQQFDQGQHYQTERISRNYKSYQTENKTSLMEQVTENLDKILFGILIVLLVAFLLRSDKKPINIEKGQDANVVLNKFVVEDKKSTQENRTKDRLKELIDQLQGKKIDQKPKIANDIKDNSISHPVRIDIDSNKQTQEQIATNRFLLHRKRSQYFTSKSKEELSLVRLAKFNLNDPANTKEQRAAWFEEQEKRVEQKYKVSEFKQKELSMCVVVHAMGHKKQYAHQYVLNSIFNQKYENYIVIYVADGHSADQVSTIKQFIKGNQNRKRVKFIWNAQSKYFLESTVSATKIFCLQKRVTVLIDGDDELLGNQVFQVINTAYRRNGANVVYGNFIEYHEDRMQLTVGFASEYEQKEKKGGIYRSVGQKFGSIKTFKTGLIEYIKDSDLRDKNGNYYRYAGDYALIYPLIELACGAVSYLPQYNYLYFGYQLDPTFGSLQISNGRQIRAKAKYDCYKKYD